MNYFMNCAAKALGEVSSTFLKAVKKVLRVEKPDSWPMASSVSSEVLPSEISFLA